MVMGTLLVVGRMGGALVRLAESYRRLKQTQLFQSDCSNPTATAFRDWRPFVIPGYKSTKMPHADPILPVASPDLLDRRWVRILLFILVPAAFFVIAGAGIRVSHLGIDHTVLVMGESRLVSGGPSAMRVTLIDDQSGFFLPERLSAWLVQGEARHLLFDREVLDAGHAVACNFTVPVLKKGAARLELHVHFSGRRRIIRRSVVVADAPAKETLSFPPDVKQARAPLQKPVGDHTVSLSTEDRGATAGLSTLLFVRTLSLSGEPVSAPFAFALPSFAGKTAEQTVEGQTGKTGLGAFPITPNDLYYPLRMAADGAGQIVPPVVYNGLKVDFRTPLPRVRDGVEMDISRISGAGALYIDVFKDGTWVFAQTVWADGERVAVTLQPPVAGLLRIQVTGSPLQAGTGVAVRHVYVMEDGDTLDSGLRAVLSRLTDETDRRWAKGLPPSLTESEVLLTASFALARLYGGHRNLPSLVSSRREDDAELGAFKARFQRGVMAAISLLGLTVAAFIGFIARQAARRQARMTRMIEADSEADEPAPGQLDLADRRWGIFQIAVLLLVLLAAFVAVGILVMTLTWS
jgi:hypothetical protein